MQYLPNREEQDWLLGALASLITTCGYAQFVTMPIVEPIPQFFPDPWAFSHIGLDRVTRRLMQYAGLSTLDVNIRTYAEHQTSGTNSETQCSQTIAGAFLGIAQERAYFAFNEQAPADAEYMAGVMGHEVAHAYRAYYKLGGAVSTTEEEWMTDVTAAYLGFGILVTNNSYRYRTSGGINYHAWSTQTVGYLSPQAFAFLLAVQIVAQGLRARERRRILRHLETTQATFTRKALDVVRDRATEILQQLNIPPRAAWEPPKRLDQRLEPLPECAASPSAAVGPDTANVPCNVGRPVFRLQRRKTADYA